MNTMNQNEVKVTGPTFRAAGASPTTIGFILAHIANGRYVLGWKFGERIGFPHSNIASLVEQFAQSNGYDLMYPPAGWMTESSFTGVSHDPDASVKCWKLDFDLMLHDAATWYTEQLVHHTWMVDNKPVDTTTFLWRMSRQLRQHMAEVNGRDEASKKNAELDRLWARKAELERILAQQKEYRHEERTQRNEAEKEIARLTATVRDLS